jgi:hypothetical protein
MAWARMQVCDEVSVCDANASLRVRTHARGWVPSSADGSVAAFVAQVFDVVRNPGGHSSTNTPDWLRMTAPDEDGRRGSRPYRIPCFRSIKYEPYVVVRRTDTLPQYVGFSMCLCANCHSSCKGRSGPCDLIAYSCSCTWWSTTCTND